MWLRAFLGDVKKKDEGEERILARTNMVWASQWLNLSRDVGVLTISQVLLLSIPRCVLNGKPIVT